MKAVRHVQLVLAAALAAALVCCAAGSGSGELAEADREYAAGNYDRAERLYQDYIEDHPRGQERWHAWNRLVDIAEGVERDPDKAASLLEAMLLEFDDPSKRKQAVLERLAATYEAAGRHEQALEAWGRVLDFVGPGSPEAAEVYLALGELHQIRGDYSLARDTMRDCLQAAEERGLEARCMYRLARYLSLLRNDVQAKAWLEKLADLQGLDPELRAQALYMLAGMYAENGRTAEARELLLSIKDDYPNPKAVEVRLGHLEGGGAN
jgi:tetratricopeptide (TPR) repeat protein